MKFVAVLTLIALCSGAAMEKDRTITQVVKLLQDMMDKSVKEGDDERVIYAKFKCYCDTSEAEKRASLKEQTELIDLLESKIAELQGDTGGLSSECAELKTAMADNEAAQDEATTIRNKENKAFTAEKADLEQAILQMKGAIETLAAVGADQTKSTGADNKQFMAGHSASLLSVQKELNHALKAATALMNPEQQSTATAFLQAPFTGTYTSQSAAVMGMIKSMRDTFMKNREDAITSEKNSLEAYDEFMKLKKAAFKEMKGSYEEKQKSLGGNDKTLSSKKKQLAGAQKQKKSDEDFLDSLLPLCEDKATEFAKRKLLRTNEEAAIAEAISILNSDDAFAAFGETSATSSGGLKFIQLHSNGKSEAQVVLQKAATQTKSARLNKVVAMLQADNVFDEVLTEIDNMIELIDEEGKADKEKLDWCNKERKDKKAVVAAKKKSILALNKAIDQLESDINDPEQGFKAQIAETEQDLVDNTEAQTKQTGERTESNLAYQQDVKNLVKAESILKKAIKVLATYYDDLEKQLAGAALLQEDPAPPKADLNMKGQSSKGGDVVTMLNFILDEAVKEETQAHSDEEKGQADYEDSMTKLKKSEADSQANLVKLQDNLAQAEKDLLDNQEDLKDTTADKVAAEDYLAKIKAGCDFITSNFKERNASRKTEKDALTKAIGLIKATPAYKSAVNAATVESYGDCDEPCVADKSDVKCKACMADVTIPAYCAGHKGTKGC